MKLRPRAAKIVAACIAVGAFLGFSHVSMQRRIAGYGVETDFYGDYVPDAARLRAGGFPVNDFEGPGYPAVLALVELAIPDPFVAGRAISAASAAASGFFTFLVFSELFGAAVGISSELLLLIGGLFPTLAMTASTDMLFLALCLAAFAAFGHRGRPSARVVTAGLVAGAAFLVRYNGAFLLPAFVVGIVAFSEFGADLRGRLARAGLLLAAALLVAAPWFYANAQKNGSPFFNSNYLNVATEFFGDRFGADSTGDGTEIMSRHFHSLGDVLRFDPARVARRYPVNLVTNVYRSLTTRLVGPFVGIAAVFGAFFAVRPRPSRPLGVSLAAGWLGFVALLGLTHWDPRYYLFAGAVYAGFAAFGLWHLARAFEYRFGRPGIARWVAIVLVVAFGAASARVSAAEAESFLRADPVEVLNACESLRGVRGARVLERKPHLAFVCGQTDVGMPLVASVSDLAQWIREHPVDYVVMSTVEAARRRGLSELRDPGRAPPWLRAVYVHDQPLFIVYAVDGSRLPDRPSEARGAASKLLLP